MYRTFQLASLILLLVNVNIMAQTTDKQEITLAYYVDPNSNLYGKWTELIYTDAFARLDIIFTYSVMPAIRASRMADLGREATIRSPSSITFVKLRSTRSNNRPKPKPHPCLRVRFAWTRRAP